MTHLKFQCYATDRRAGGHQSIYSWCDMAKDVSWNGSKNIPRCIFQQQDVSSLQLGKSNIICWAIDIVECSVVAWNSEIILNSKDRQAYSQALRNVLPDVMPDVRHHCDSTTVFVALRRQSSWSWPGWRNKLTLTWALQWCTPCLSGQKRTRRH